MSREEAIQAMKQGERITHRYFSDDEFIYMDDPLEIKDESGYAFPAWLFWSHRNTEQWNDGFDLFNTNKEG